MAYKSPLIFVTALSCEARPLLDAWDFNKIESSPFAIYHSAKDKLLLIISGVGSDKSATAVRYLASKIRKREITALVDTRDSIWINFGIAGHREHELGRGFLIHKINDISRNMSFYPWRLPYYASAEINCHMQGQNRYPADSLVDMESAGFFANATSITANELVHLYKVVSDNSGTSVLDKEGVAKLLAPHIPNLDTLATKLRKMTCDEFSGRREMREVIDEWKYGLQNLCRWTFTQEQQLLDVLSRYYALGKNPINLMADKEYIGKATGKNRAKEILHWLNQTLSDTTDK